MDEIFKEVNALSRELYKLEDALDRVFINRLFSYYKLESAMYYDEGGEDLGLDHKLLDSIEELVKYIGTEEEIAEFGLLFKQR